MFPPFRLPSRPCLWPVAAVLFCAMAGSVRAQTFYSHGEPNADEQFELELLNAARANPAATGERLAALSDPFYTRAFTFYGVDLNALRAQFASYPPRPPLAFHPALIAAARAHTADMVNNHFQSHTGSDGSNYTSRAQAAGYPSPYVSENAAGTRAYPSYEASVNGGDLVDWGVSSLGHRTNILDLYANYPGAVEVGIGTGPDATDTQDFGYYFSNAPAYLTGVAYRDLNHNGRYDQGEGLADVTITVDGNVAYTVTGASGGYALPLSGRGGQTAHAFGGPLGADAATRGFSTGGESVKWDLVQDSNGNLIGGGGQSGVAVSVEGNYDRHGFVLTRTGDLSGTLTISYHVGGSAIGGVDYDTLSGSVTFEAGAAEAFIPLVAHSTHGKVKMFVDAGAGYSPAPGKGKLLLANL